MDYFSLSVHPEVVYCNTYGLARKKRKGKKKLVYKVRKTFILFIIEDQDLILFIYSAYLMFYSHGFNCKIDTLELKGHRVQLILH